MAKKPKAKKKANGASAGPGPGHNFKVDRKEVKLAVDQISRLFDEMESERAESMLTIKDSYERHANLLGCSRKNLRQIVKEHRDEAKKQAKDRERETADQDELDKLRLAIGSYGSSPLGKAALERAERTQAAQEMTDA